METLFLSVLNMSITASYVILFVMLVRLLLKKAPKLFSYALWSIVLIRLVLPFSIGSIFSLIPINPQTVPPDIMYRQSPRIDSGIRLLDRAVNGALPAPVPGDSMNQLQLWIALGATVWLLGIAVLLLYSAVTTARLSLKLKVSKPMGGNIYEMDGIKSPFVFGFFRPKIYLPQSLAPNERDYILTHEQTHIKRFDHIIKPCAFFVLCVHWFNPLAWVAFFLMGEDMEFSCDESVIKKLGSDIKQDYSISLLSLSTGRRIVGGCPLAFGENDTKGRIKNVLNYRKPALWVAIVTVIAVAAVGIGLMASPDKAPPVVGDEMADSEITLLAERLMQKAETVFWWYHSDLSVELEVDESYSIMIDGQEWQKIGKFQTMAQLKAATEAVFTLDFCEANLYDRIERSEKFKEVNGVLYNSYGGGMGWAYSLPKKYIVKSAGKDKIVLTAICDSINPNSDTQDMIECEFELILLRESNGWKLDNYYNYTSEGYVRELWANAAPKKITASEQDAINQIFIQGIIAGNNEIVYDTPVEIVSYPPEKIDDKEYYRVDIVAGNAPSTKLYGPYYVEAKSSEIYQKDSSQQLVPYSSSTKPSEPSSGPWVEKAFPVPAMDAEQQMYNDTYIRPILLTGLLWENWGEGDYAAISPDPVNDPQADYLILAFEDITGMEKMKEIFSTYGFNLPAQVVEEVLLARFPFTADQLHEILAFYYRPEEKVYYYESGRGGGPIECAVTGVKDDGSGTVTLEYVTLVGYYDEGLTPEQEEYLYKRHGTLTLKQSPDGSYRYWSVKVGLEEEAHPE